MAQLIEIDGLTRDDHAFLTPSDRCYYVMEYNARKGYRFSAANQLITNFKKPMDRRGLPEWPYKAQAIQQLATNLRGIMPPEALRGFTIVPMPPSKCKTDPLYDDRLLQVLAGMSSGHAVDIREILYLEESMPSSHESAVRPKPEDLKRRYKVNEEICEPIPLRIIIFDDMITAGAHFRACSDLLKGIFPDIEILGVFISRRVFPTIYPNDTFKVL